jgi:predicted nucleotidyltransferase
MIYSIEELSKRITPVAKKYNLRAVYVFGSYARNEATEDSDIDILIDRTDSRVKSLFELGGLYNEICESIGKEIDMLTTHALLQDNDDDQPPRFRENVMKERVPLYEQ